MVSKPIDGKPATHANGGTIGFSISDPKQVDAWHKAAVANGGTTIEDPPGVRQGASGELYLVAQVLGGRVISTTSTAEKTERCARK
jgi:hypothetical protein